MLTALAAIAGFGAIVFFHELGHFVAARISGLPVERFSIGFPPHIVKIKGPRTEYCIGAIPLGGYVKVDLGTSGETSPESPWYLRLLTAACGPLFNLLLAAMLFFIVLAVVGQDISVFSNVVGPGGNTLGLAEGDTVLAVNGTVTADFSSVVSEMRSAPAGGLLAGTDSGRVSVDYSFAGEEDIPGFVPFIPPVIGESIIGLPAYEAGMRAGDSVVAVDGIPVSSWADMLARVEESGGSEMNFAFLRDDSIYTARLEPMEIEGRYRVGVVAMTTTETLRYPVPEALLYSVKASLGGTVMIFRTLAMVFTRPEELVAMSGGPIFVAETLDQEAGKGLGRLLEAVAGISLAVMCFNLLPIPILDGGQMLMLLYEGVTRKRLSGRAFQVVQQVGLLLILLLFVLIMWRDIARLFLRVNRPGL